MNTGFKSFKKNIFFLVAGVVAGVVMMAAILHFFPLDFSENEIRRECNQWQDWAREIRKDLFSPSAEMVEQCRKVGVELPAKK